MRFVLPGENTPIDPHQDPGRWALLPGLCCQAAGGELGATLEISAAWLLLYTAAHTVDTIEDGDRDPQIDLLGGPGAAINTANGLFLSAVQLVNSLRKKDIPGSLDEEILADFLDTILIMASGQHRDLTLPMVDLNQWWQIAESKSGAFFSLACRSGARLGSSDLQKVKHYSEYGFRLGLLLQIIDDLEEFNQLENSDHSFSSSLLERSLAVAYADSVLPDGAKRELNQLFGNPILSEENSNKLLTLLDQCGAGLYMVAEVERQVNQALTELEEAQPEKTAGEKLMAIIEAFKLNFEG